MLKYFKEVTWRLWIHELFNVYGQPAIEITLKIFQNYLQEYVILLYKSSEPYLKDLHIFCCFLPVYKLQEAIGSGSVILDITHSAGVLWLPVKKKGVSDF